MDNELIIKDYFADWCLPCKVLHKILDEVVIETGVKVEFLNIEEIDPPLDIKALPTLHFIKNNAIVDKHTGSISKTQLLSKIERFK